MNRVLIWDHTGDSPKWCKTYLEKNDVEVIQTIPPSYFRFCRAFIQA